MDELLGPVIGIGIGALLFLLIVYAASTFTVRPREAHVMLYWGKYRRTITRPGFYTASPFGLSRNVISTRDVAVPTPITTVVDTHGSPIQVSAVIVYRVADAAKALIDVQGYQAYVLTQASTVVKMVCSRFPYESSNPEEPSLKKESHEIIDALLKTLQAQVSAGGVQILLVRLNDLTYAPEIAQSMLLRQQAQAMVDARRTLVEGAVATVKDGIERLEAAGFKLTGAKRARLASNLTLLLCAGERGEQHSTVIARQRH
jgi:regulator of protease activity HflC (stomatin/prohibitin superfamily)